MHVELTTKAGRKSRSTASRAALDAPATLGRLKRLRRPSRCGPRTANGTPGARWRTSFAVHVPGCVSDGHAKASHRITHRAFAAKARPWQRRGPAQGRGAPAPPHNAASHKCRPCRRLEGWKAASCARLRKEGDRRTTWATYKAPLRPGAWRWRARWLNLEVCFSGCEARGRRPGACASQTS